MRLCVCVFVPVSSLFVTALDRSALSTACAQWWPYQSREVGSHGNSASPHQPHAAPVFAAPAPRPQWGCRWVLLPLAFCFGLLVTGASALLWSRHEGSLRREATVLARSSERQRGSGLVRQSWVSGRHSEDETNWAVGTDARVNGHDTAWETKSELPNCLWRPRDYYRETPKSHSAFIQSF